MYDIAYNLLTGIHERNTSLLYLDRGEYVKLGAGTKVLASDYIADDLV